MGIRILTRLMTVTKAIILFAMTLFVFNITSILDQDAVLSLWKQSDSYDLLRFRFQTDKAVLKYSYPFYGVVPKTVLPSDDTAGLIEEIGGQNIETSVLFRFSPFVTNHVKAMFASHVRAAPCFRIHAVQASCFPRQSRLRCVLRMNLYFRQQLAAGNRYQENFVYSLDLDENLNYVQNSGHLLSVPSPIQDDKWTGPEDPRLVVFNDSYFVTFINGHDHPGFSVPLRHQFIWSMEKNMLYNLKINDYTLQLFEKNWVPMIFKDTFHFVYQLLPQVRLISCQLGKGEDGYPFGNCSFTGGGSPENTSGKRSINYMMLLRGGSTFVPYYKDYYISVTHTTQIVEPTSDPNSAVRGYASQLVMINAATSQTVFVSSPIFVERSLLANIEPLYRNTIQWPFFFSTGLVVENDDSLIVSGNVNDNECFIIRMQGVGAILHKAIENDQKRIVNDGERLTATSPTFVEMENWIRKRNLEEIEIYLDRSFATFKQLTLLQNMYNID